MRLAIGGDGRDAVRTEEHLGVLMRVPGCIPRRRVGDGGQGVLQRFHGQGPVAGLGGPLPGRPDPGQPVRERPGRHRWGGQGHDRDRQPGLRRVVLRRARGVAPGGVRPAGGQRQRRRHGPRDPQPPVRAVLHDQGGGPGDRARAGHGLRDREAERRVPERVQRAGRGTTFRVYLPRHEAETAPRPGRRSAGGRPSCWSRTTRPCCG